VTFDVERHHRRSLRLRGYDYSRAGAYFVTLCTRQRECLFGDVIDDAMVLNEHGRVVQAAWNALPTHYPRVDLDAFVVMPNHVHGVILVGAIHESPSMACPSLGVSLHGEAGAGAIRESPLHGQWRDEVARRRRMTIPLIVGRVKSTSAIQINVTRGTPGVPVWQRNYYEHVIRNDDDLNRIRQYIADNPRNWPSDQETPSFFFRRRV